MVTTGYYGQATAAIPDGDGDLPVIVNTKSYGGFGIGVGTPDRLYGATHYYNDNHDMAWHYYAFHGLVNTDVPPYRDGPYAPFRDPGRRVVLLRIRGGMLSFAVDGVDMPGAWPIPSPANLIVSACWPGGTVDISYIPLRWTPMRCSWITACVTTGRDAHAKGSVRK